MSADHGHELEINVRVRTKTRNVRHVRVHVRILTRIYNVKCPCPWYKKLGCPCSYPFAIRDLKSGHGHEHFIFGMSVDRWHDSIIAPWTYPLPSARGSQAWVRRTSTLVGDDSGSLYVGQYLFFWHQTQGVSTCILRKCRKFRKCPRITDTN